MMELRPHQRQALEACQQAYTQGKLRALVVAPTGWGKTVLFAFFLAWYQQQDQKPVLVLAHRDELLEQAAQKIKVVLPRVGIGKVGGGVQEWGSTVTVASVQTVYQEKYLQQLRALDYGLVICDEAHHMKVVCDSLGNPLPGKGNSYQRIVEALPDAFWLGVTATPDRLDKHPITGFLSDLIYTSDVLEMIEQGWLVDIRAIAIRTCIDLDGIKKQAGDYQLKQLAAVVDSPERNQRVVDAYLEHASDRRAICFAVNVAHAEHLTSAFCQAGIAAALVIGETPHEERKYLYVALKSGQLRVLISVLVLTEGFDLPEIDCILMARPTQSRALFAQALGRGLRLSPETSKQDCLLLDITDNILKHSLAPMNLAGVLHLPALLPDETALEAKKRERQEQRDREERLQRVRQLFQRQRPEDVQVHVRTRCDWQQHPHGMLVTVVGANNHRIALVPGPQKDYYAVWARLAPKFEAQLWLADSPLEWAQQFAEREIRKLLSEPQAVALVDRHAPWRFSDDPPTEKQVALLLKYGEPIPSTKVEASEMISKLFAEKAARRLTRKQQHRA